ncbi:hypothetical protein, partial [Calditerricola satsumensis]|uniref:hypothetical protein n=1 Tax=Calditerricola satsumensis TaxID=373054 RepID=UPI001C44DA91
MSWAQQLGSKKEGAIAPSFRLQTNSLGANAAEGVFLSSVNNKEKKLRAWRPVFLNLPQAKSYFLRFAHPFA